MKGLNLSELRLEPSLPRRIAASPHGEIAAVDLVAGEEFGDHSVRNRAWLLVLDGEITVRDAAGIHSASSGSFVEIGVGERSSVAADSDSRLLLCSVGWPGYVGRRITIDPEGYLDD